MLAQDSCQPVFRALADPTRRAILEIVAKEPRSVAEIVSHFNMTRPAVAKHLKILQEGGLIDVGRQGRKRINRLRPQALEPATNWLTRLDRFWDEKLHNLKRAVEDENR